MTPITPNTQPSQQFAELPVISWHTHLEENSELEKALVSSPEMQCRKRSLIMLTANSIISVIIISLITATYVKQKYTNKSFIFESTTVQDYFNYHDSLTISNFVNLLLTEIILVSLPIIHYFFQSRLKALGFQFYNFLSMLQFVYFAIQIDFSNFDPFDSLLGGSVINSFQASLVYDIYHHTQSLVLQFSIGLIVMGAVRLLIGSLYTYYSFLGSNCRTIISGLQANSFSELSISMLSIVPLTLVQSLIISSKTDAGFALQIMSIVAIIIVVPLNLKFQDWKTSKCCRFWAITFVLAVTYFLVLVLVCFKCNSLYSGFEGLTPKMFICSVIFSVIFLTALMVMDLCYIAFSFFNRPLEVNGSKMQSDNLHGENKPNDEP
ncbi:unnamed protein product [Ambrosiozyma monospora]|uniref:Unnamed protein product n=1 Tax=Ambrosiozyma monospora TaxID=43982 RepID=A0A9W7DKA0_AMBMO|nr:unnamed protein product [Ambrosiozyma monospora]